MSAVGTAESVPLNNVGRTWSPRRSTLAELLIGAIVVTATIVVPLAVGDVYWTQVFLLANVYVIAAVSLNVLRGEAGQISFGQGAIFGAAAYGTGMAAGMYDVAIVPAMGIGVLAGLAFGLVLALPALRVQGYYLAFVTVAAAVVFPDMLRAFDEHTHAITGISVLVPDVGTPVLWKMDWVTLAILGATIAALIGHAVIRSSRLGRQMRVSAASSEAALSLGVNPGYMRVLAFAISALGTGVAGALYVALFGFISPGAFPLALSILIYFSVVVGGESTIVGPILGVYLLWVLPNNVLTDFVEYRLLIYGSIALFVMLLFPSGLVGTIRDLLYRIFERPAGQVISVAELIDDSDNRAGVGRVFDPDSEPVLQVSNATRNFGAVRALDDVTFDVKPGEIHGLVGPNGSGKTTLLNALSGFVRLDAGEISIDGVNASRRSARQRAQDGIGRTFQTPRVFEDMSVWENIEITSVRAGRQPNLSAKALHERRGRYDSVRATTLPHGQRRLLEVVRVLRFSPRILLLDEPAAGLSPVARTELATSLVHVAHIAGVAIVLVEHDLSLVWSIADRITVIDEGRIQYSGPPADLGTEALETVFMLGGARAQSD